MFVDRFDGTYRYQSKIEALNLYLLVEILQITTWIADITTKERIECFKEALEVP